MEARVVRIGRVRMDMVGTVLPPPQVISDRGCRRDWRTSDRVPAEYDAGELGRKVHWLRRKFLVGALAGGREAVGVTRKGGEKKK